jgi:hypothetical protein
VAAQLRAHARHQFARAEGLDEVVVGARIQRLDLAGLGAARRQHDHGHRRPLAQVADQVHAVAVGQAQVQHHQVGAARAGLDQAALQGGGLVHLVALGLQGEPHEAADVGLVFDDQDLGGVGHGETFARRAAVRAPSGGRAVLIPANCPRAACHAAG